MTTLQERLKQMKERADKATPGPWENRCRELSNTEIPRHIWSNYGWLASTNGPLNSTIADAEFVAHALTDVPALIAALETATEQKDMLLELIEELGFEVELNGDSELLTILDGGKV